MRSLSSTAVTRRVLEGLALSGRARPFPAVLFYSVLVKTLGSLGSIGVNRTKKVSDNLFNSLFPPSADTIRQRWTILVDLPFVHASPDGENDILFFYQFSCKYRIELGFCPSFIRKELWSEDNDAFLTFLQTFLNAFTQTITNPE